MSKSMRQSQAFLNLLLNTSKGQSKALIYTLAPHQTTALCEILLNIDDLALNSKILEVLQKHRNLIQKLTNARLSLSKRQAIIQNHYLKVIKILLLVKNPLLKLIL